MSDNRPIGVFDSGVGGLLALRELKRIMPNESFIYYGDRANAPYGNKSREELITITKNISETLISLGAKAILIACNTTTATSIEILRQSYPSLPFIGIEPAVAAAHDAHCRRVLVLATVQTIASERFDALRKKYTDENCCIVGVPCPELASMIEEGGLTPERAEEYLRGIFSPYAEDGFDGVVLGCTHYPYVKDQICSAAGHFVQIFDGAEKMGYEAQEKLARLGMTASADNVPTLKIISSDGTLFLDEFYSKYCK